MPDLTALHVDSPLSYAVAFTLPALDAVVPVLPSETAIIALGAASVGTTDPRLGLLDTAGGTRSVRGGQPLLLIGRHFKDWTNRRFFAGEKGGHRRDLWS